MRSVLCLMAGAWTLLAQQVVPVHQEPRHRPVFENGFVRALDVRFDVGTASLYHRHALPNIAVRIVGGITRADPIDGLGTPVDTPAGRVTWYSASPPYVHRVVNVGAGPVHIVDVELLGRPLAPTAASADDVQGHTVEVDNAQVRVSRVRLAPGTSLPIHTHPRGWLEVIVSGGSPGAVAWHDAGRHADAVTAGAAAREWIEIEPR